jgi:hypothetical protein
MMGHKPVAIGPDRTAALMEERKRVVAELCSKYASGIADGRSYTRAELLTGLTVFGQQISSWETVNGWIERYPECRQVWDETVNLFRRSVHEIFSRRFQAALDRQFDIAIEPENRPSDATSAFRSVLQAASLIDALSSGVRDERPRTAVLPIVLAEFRSTVRGRPLKAIAAADDYVDGEVREIP